MCVAHIDCSFIGDLLHQKLLSELSRFLVDGQVTSAICQQPEKLMTALRGETIFNFILFY